VTAMRVSVIVLNYNGRQWLDGCLNALALQKGAPSFEIIVADNGSTDGSIVWLAKHHPHVRVLRNGTNLGFAAGNNAGAAQATGDWLVFLNNDTVPEPDWLAELCRPLGEHSDLTMATSRVVFIDDPRVVDSAGDGYLRAGGAYKRGHRAEVSGFLESCEVFGACGAAFIVRRDAFHAVGGFDERFFMVYEDVDLSYRLRLAGHRCWYAAAAVVRHVGSGTLGRSSPTAVYYGQRNLEWTWIKNTPGPLMLRTAAPHIVYSLAGLVHYLRRGRFGPALRGKLAAVAGVAAMLRARRQMRPLRRVDWRAIDRWLDRGWVRLKQREKAAALSASR
jgi:N-acetylglucosaminyl-diphospho-decaprenol L-rhamnosyltransferase